MTVMTLAYHHRLRDFILKAMDTKNYTISKAAGYLRIQILVVVICSVVLPYFVIFNENIFSQSIPYEIKSASVYSLFASIASVVAFRKLGDFPSVRALGFVIPVVATCYGIMAFVLLVARLSYSSVYVIMSLSFSVFSLFVLAYIRARYERRRVFVVPFGKVSRLLGTQGADWVTLEAPDVPLGKSIIVADLHVDLQPEWERMLASAAIRGHTIYHYKQLGELLTGKVTIEHLSENNLGSLVPNRIYTKVKRLVDVTVCLIFLPFVIVILAIIAILIKIDSRGPIFFVQKRRGYSGEEFRMIKLRTMRPTMPLNSESIKINSFMTQSSDARITRIGKYLRKTRLDELPQFFNVLAGHMSLIGPRPEAMQLSHWYEEKIPFYTYRHIVRPGISGWAQVHQGHVTDIDAVYEKLSYDFYYIKNFSAWLDILIAIRTFVVMLSGFGAR